MGIRNPRHSSLLRCQRGPQVDLEKHCVCDRRVSPPWKLSFCSALMHRFGFGIIHV